MNPSSRLFSKRCKKCGCTFECNEKWINDNNIDHWIVKEGRKTNKEGQPLLCRLRTECLCDDCRTIGGVNCNTEKKDPLEELY